MPSPSFNAPIPGESLAHPPGSFPWDRPPQYTKPDEAITFIWKNLIKPSQLPKILHLLENGATVADIAKGTLVAGFQKGLWSIDLMMLIDQNVFLMIATLAEKAGIKYQLLPPGGPGDVDQFFAELNLDLMKAKMGGTPEDVSMAFDQASGAAPQAPIGNPEGNPPQEPPTPPGQAPTGNGMFSPPQAGV